MHMITALILCSLAVDASAASNSKPVGVVYKEGSKTAVKAGSDKATAEAKALGLLKGKSKAEVKGLLEKLRKAVKDKKKAEGKAKPPAPPKKAAKPPAPAPPAASKKAEKDLDNSLKKLESLVKKDPTSAKKKTATAPAPAKKKKATAPAPAKKDQTQEVMELLKQAKLGAEETDKLLEDMKKKSKPVSDDDISEELDLISSDDDDASITADEDDYGGDDDDEEVATNFDDELALIAKENSKNGPKRTIPMGADFSPDFAEDFDSADNMSPLTAEEKYLAEEEAAIDAANSQGSMQFYLFIVGIAGVAAALYYYRDSPTPAWAKHLLHGELNAVSIPGFSPEVDKKAKQSLLSGLDKCKEATSLDDFGSSYGGLSTGPTSINSGPRVTGFTSMSADIEEFGL